MFLHLIPHFAQLAALGQGVPPEVVVFGLHSLCVLQPVQQLSKVSSESSELAANRYCWSRW